MSFHVCTQGTACGGCPIHKKDKPRSGDTLAPPRREGGRVFGVGAPPAPTDERPTVPDETDDDAPEHESRRERKKHR